MRNHRRPSGVVMRMGGCDRPRGGMNRQVGLAGWLIATRYRVRGISGTTTGRAFVTATSSRGPLVYFHSVMEFVDGNCGAGCQAIDLGCGGADSQGLLARCWLMFVPDAEPQSNADDLILKLGSTALRGRCRRRVAWPRLPLPSSRSGRTGPQRCQAPRAHR